MAMIVKVNGHRPDPPNENYLQFTKSMFIGVNKVSEGDVDLRPFSSPRHDQRKTSTCVAQSVIKAIEIKRIMKYGHPAHIPLSVMDLYFSGRDLMNPKETDKDEGTFIYLACEVLKRFGVCREVMNPFDERNLFIPTPIMATREAYLNKIQTSHRLNSTGWDRVDDVIANLQVGNPVVFGTLIGDNWFKYKRDSEPLGPVKFEDGKGRHATCLVGWVDGKFIIENSWGPWGDNGFGWLQPEVIADVNSQDFWTVTTGFENYLDKANTP